ncbi:MAG: PAS domain-containing protein [Flavipsychrobacter sp.]|nr:PAS domain-containing protein [Flavipsychrobacter sp.]
MDHTALGQLTDKQPHTALPDPWSILESGPGSVAVIDIRTYEVVFCNSQFQYVFGYNEQEVKAPGFTFRQLISEDQLERFMMQVELVQGNREALSRYVVYRLKDRQQREASYFVYLAPLQGHPDKFHTLIIPDKSSWSFPFNSFDSRDLFLQQIETEMHGSFEWMLSTQKVFWTESLYDIYEIDRDTPVDRKMISTFTHPDDAARTAAAIQQALDSRELITVEMRIITGKQNLKILRAMARFIFNDSGKPIKFVGSIKDISGQRKIEQDLKHKVEELNRSNKELEEFAYVASHDLQEPLRKISTFSGILSEKFSDQLTGDGTMYLERMIASADNMRNLINNLLEFSRVTRDKQPFSQVDLNFVLAQVKNELELSIEETQTIIKSEALPQVNGSLSQLKQLFCNIIANAIKFRKEGEAPLITIAVAPLPKEEVLIANLVPNAAYHKITITDNGIGFEKEYAEKIFQIFQRLHGKSEYPGSGIGLAICKRIAEHHKGAIYATGQEGNGAAFTIILPAINTN